MIYSYKSSIKIGTPYYLGFNKTNNAINYQFGLLGIDKSKLTIKYSDKTLHIFVKEDDEEIHYVHNGSISQSIDSMIDENNVSAKLENGVLTITILLKEKKDNTKLIPIQ